MSSSSEHREHHPHLGAHHYSRTTKSGNTAKLVGLFTATALVVGVAALALSADSESATETFVDENDPNYCTDDNGDNYCDDDGSSINTAAFILVGAMDVDVDKQKKKYYRTGSPDQTRTYRPPASATAGKTVTTPPSNSSTPPSSSSGTGQVISKSGTSSSSTSSSSSSSASSSKSSSSSGISSGKSSGSGGIGSSSSSSSS